ncbi:hypothetical protein ACQ27_gp286 [Klebsiella phage K64-1]|uniref:hypothetical protein n=1 Tax=Klebsiella phage K64-1 TaxID=1439894 RepID=UPI0018A48095|nr:hypothetical protein ACQ27_gp286 [Klebsiella phage K64-1]QOE32638.1 hypothetical protein CPT_Muenster_472 [Klebsiella phage Muenster]
MKKFLSKEHEENILNALSVFPESVISNNKNSTYYYGKGNWFYFSDSSYMCVLNLCTEEYSYCLRIDPRYKLILLCEKNDEFYESEIDDTDSYISNFYLEEDVYFMDSTVNEITIPFSIMKRSHEFLKYSREKFHD